MAKERPSRFIQTWRLLMSCSDRESSNVGIFGGIGGAIVLVLIIGVRVTLRTVARQQRNHDIFSTQRDTDYGDPPSNMPETNRDAARITKIGGRPSSGLQHESGFEKMRAETERRLAEDRAAEAESRRQEAERLEAERQQREQA